MQKAMERADDDPERRARSRGRCSCRGRRTPVAWPNCCIIAVLLERRDDLPDDRVAHAEQRGCTSAGDEQEQQGEGPAARAAVGAGPRPDAVVGAVDRRGAAPSRSMGSGLCAGRGVRRPGGWTPGAPEAGVHGAGAPSLEVDQGVIFSSYSLASAVMSPPPRDLAEELLEDLRALDRGPAGAAGVSFELSADSIRALANWSSPSEPT